MRPLISQDNIMTGQDSQASGSHKKLDKTQTNILSRNPDGHFSCSQCYYTNTQKHNVLLHMQSVHEGKFYGCDMCLYKTSRKLDL